MNERRIMLSVRVFGLYISGNNGVKCFVVVFIVVVFFYFCFGGGHI